MKNMQKKNCDGEKIWEVRSRQIKVGTSATPNATEYNWISFIKSLQSDTRLLYVEFKKA
jgi:hypothetical protein